MDLKKKMKAFFTLKRRANDGFTLVELIVVIAILAILGGVAVPAYSGYVKKAERTADEQLLNAVNKAYASACLQKGTDVYLLEAASLTLDPIDKTVEKVHPYDDAFQMFYAGNEHSAFKVYENIVFDDSKHMFVELSNASSFAIAVGDVVYKASAEDVLAFKNSSLGQLGAGEIVGMVDLAVKELGVTVGSGALPAALQSNSYKAEAAKAMGLVNADADEATAVAAYTKYISDKKEAAIQQYYKDNNITTTPNPIQDKAAKDAAQAQIDSMEKNMIAVVGAAKSEEAAAGLVDILKSGNAYDTLRGNVYDENNSALGISQSALAYALYASYAGDQADGAGYLSALNGFDDGFKEYLEDTERVEADLAGAMGAMNVVGSQNNATLEHTVINGVGNDELAEALEQIFGK